MLNRINDNLVETADLMQIRKCAAVLCDLQSIYNNVYQILDEFCEYDFQHVHMQEFESIQACIDETCELLDIIATLKQNDEIDIRLIVLAMQSQQVLDDCFKIIRENL